MDPAGKPEAQGPGDLIGTHFRGLQEPQLLLLERLIMEIRRANETVNLVSRRDIDHLLEHHILHCLIPYRLVTVNPGARILDLGTGGGLPGLALAIAWPKARITLLDSVAKKVAAVESIRDRLGLANVRIARGRAEECGGVYDYVFGRAVAPLPRFLAWAHPLLERGRAGSHANGVFYFKGTAWREELEPFRLKPARMFQLERYLPFEYYRDKFLLHFPCDACRPFAAAARAAAAKSKNPGGRRRPR